MIDVWRTPDAIVLSAARHHDGAGEILKKFHDLGPIHYHLHTAGDVARTETCGVPCSKNRLHAPFSTSAPSHDGEATDPDTYLFHHVALGAKGETSPHAICASSLEHPLLPCASMPRYGNPYL